jgi:hypothetical protein
MDALTYSRAATKRRARAVKVQQTPMIMGPLLSVILASYPCWRPNVRSRESRLWRREEDEKTRRPEGKEYAKRVV